MAMTGGSVTITAHADGSATYSGTGLALVLAQARFATIAAQWASSATQYAGSTLPSNLLSTYQSIATSVGTQCTSEADALVTYIQANATAHVTSQVLGITPNPNNANTNIQPPSSPVDIPIT